MELRIRAHKSIDGEDSRVEEIVVIWVWQQSFVVI